MALFTDMLYPRRTQRAQKDRTITRRLTQVHAVAQCERWERNPPLKTRGGAPVKPSKSTQSRDWGEGKDGKKPQPLRLPAKAEATKQWAGGNLFAWSAGDDELLE